jgi:hypothetical protein
MVEVSSGSFLKKWAAEFGTSLYIIWIICIEKMKNSKATVSFWLGLGKHKSDGCTSCCCIFLPRARWEERQILIIFLVNKAERKAYRLIPLLTPIPFHCTVHIKGHRHGI